MTTTVRFTVRNVRATIARLALVLLTAIGVSAQVAYAQENHVDLWVAASWADDLWPIVEAALNEKYPEVEVTVTPGMGGADIAALRTALVAGQGPDLFQANAAPSRMGLLAEAGLLLPLESYYENYGWNDTLLPWAKRRTMFVGPNDAEAVTYGVPQNVEFMAVFYKESVFNELGLTEPSTYEEFVELLQTLKDNGYMPIIGGFRDTFPRGWFISTYFQAAAGREQIEEILYGNGSWDNESILQAAVAVQELAQAEYLIPESHSIGSDEAFQLWLNNPRAGLIITGSWEVPTCMEQGCRFFALPSLEAGGEGGLIGGVGGGLAISANAGDPDAAAKVLDVLFSEEVQRQMTEQIGRIDPVAYDHSSWSLDDGVEMIAQLALNPNSDIGYNLSVVTPSLFVDEYYVAVQGLMLGQLTPESFTQRLQAAWEASKAQ